MFAEVHRATAFELPADVRARFLQLHKWLTQKPPPPTLQRLSREGGARTDWSRRFTESVLSRVQEGVAASRYHLSRLEEIELETLEVAARQALKFHWPAVATLAGGNTRKLDFEFQALVLAGRRTLDYLAGSVGAFFKVEVSSIRDLKSAIRSKDPEGARNGVLAELETLSELKEFVKLGDGNSSTRDMISHRSPVAAGILHIFRTSSGGIAVEVNTQLDPLRTVLPVPDGEIRTTAKLAPALLAKVARIETLVFRAYSCLAGDREF